MGCKWELVKKKKKASHIKILVLIDRQWEFAAWLRELKPGLCNNLEEWSGEADGREAREGEDICTPMADSCWGLPETNIIL